MPDGTVIKDVPRRALAVYAHPDDPDISCGGTLARWSAAGSEVHVVLCATGDKGSSNPDDDPKEVARRRFDEARRATDLLGVRSLQHLDRPDGEVENDLSTREELVSIIRRITPDVVVCPDPSAVFFGGHHYNHRDHRMVGWAVLDSVAPAAASPLYFPEAGPPHQVGAVLMSGSLEPNAWVDVTTTIDLKAQIDQGWHVYSISQGPGGPIPTRIVLAPGQPFDLIGTVRGPAPATRFDSNFGINVETYDDRAAFGLIVHVAADARVGTDTVTIKARFQTCNASLCLPPRTETILVPVTVIRAAKRVATPSASKAAA